MYIGIDTNHVSVLQIMDLNSKLTTLAQAPETNTIRLQDLVGLESVPIVGARRVTTRYGRRSIVLDITRGGTTSSVFLPPRFTEVLDDRDLQDIARDSYKILVTDGGEGSVPNIRIAKKC